VLGGRRHVGHRLVGDRAGGCAALDGHVVDHDLGGPVALDVAGDDAHANCGAVAEGAG
jgi:hypothetical protein